MPWKETDVRSERVEFVVRAERGDVSMTGLCREFGIARKTGYKWLHRFHEVGTLAGLDEYSRRPHQSPHRTPAFIEEEVESLRRETGWGGRKIQRCLSRRGILLARSTVDRIIKRRGWVESRTRHRPAVTRFERSRPNELLQMDFKGPYPLPGGRICYPLSLIDDHSRYALGLDALPSQHTEQVQSRLIGHFEHYGVPEAMLMDHGNPWWGTTNGYGLTRLSVFLIDQGIDLIYGGIGHPQTQGKVERFHRTLNEAMQRRALPRTLEGYQKAFTGFREQYNEVRPHEALEDATPQERYHPSPKDYQPNPPDWQYPPAAEVERVAGNGCVHLDGRYRFVCHALVGKLVQCQRFGDRVLITYRHMQIRELNLATGRTTAVVRPVSQNCEKVLPMS